MKPFSIMLISFWSLCFNLLPFCTLIFQPCRATLLSNETDHLSLLKFKESISGDPYQILDSWNTSTHFCNWEGVTCSHKHQRVTQLQLDEYHLHGPISPHVGNLSFLRILRLQGNSFYGEIPQELGRLSRLQILGLTNNTLTGKFPIQVTNCSKLKKLSFLANKLVGKIPMEVGTLHNLVVLLLEKNNFTGQIPASIWNLSSLSVISMNFNNLEGNIPEEIGHLKNLEVLNLASNNISGPIPSSLYNLSYLYQLVLAKNQINCSLPSNMFITLPNLQLFEIGVNQFSGPLPTSIMNASLVKISIDQNHFLGPVPSFGKSHDISLLSLGHNNLGSNSAKDWDFLKSLVNCSKLEVIDLGDINFGDHLPNTIGNLSAQVKQLYLDNNQISGKIPQALGNLINLGLLNLEMNYFTDIPTTFGKFEEMQVLHLSGNKLSGEMMPFIGNLTQLFDLDLSNNMFEGHVPPTIRNCESLQSLDLSRNNFSGAIPVEMIGLPYLSILLNLSHNSFSGDLPNEVGKLKKIETLDVSHNQLSGNIPGSIGDCESLEYLFLQENFFQGTISLSLASLKSLRYLDLSQNNLTGSIPKGLEDISVLEYLNVSFNMLDGEVPKRGVFSNASATSLTGNRELCGGILELKLPPCLIKDKEERKNHIFRLVVAICCVVAFLLVLSFAFVIYCKRKRNKISLSSPTIDPSPIVTYRNLHIATDGFSANNLIGSGSFGSVYKGNFESHIVAIKVLNLQTKGAHKSFMAECNSLKNRRHRNLVKISTCCSSIDYKGHEFKALVYEYMVNGSLENWLHSATQNPDHPRILPLDQILNILFDVASALHYLHHECERPLVHCDLKPSNILLDGNMVAHLSDFGLARLLSVVEGISNKISSTIGIKGTIGYVPPEYGMNTDVSIQGDMYSFGILVLETLTKRRPIDDMFKGGHNLHRYVEIAFPDKLLQVVDPTILHRESEDTVIASGELWENMRQIHPEVEKCLWSLFKIGLACSMESPHERMSSADVIRELSSVKSYLPSRTKQKL